MKIIVIDYIFIDYIYEVDYDVTADFSKEPMTESQEGSPTSSWEETSPAQCLLWFFFFFSENEAVDSPLAVTITLLTPTFYRF